MTKTKGATPYEAIERQYFPRAFLEGVWRELQSKAAMWQAGIDKPREADKLAYDMLRPLFDPK